MPVILRLEDDGRYWCKINRSANQNGTARIIGGIRLRDWFQSRFQIKGIVEVDFHSELLIVRRKP